MKVLSEEKMKEKLKTPKYIEHLIKISMFDKKKSFCFSDMERYLKYTESRNDVRYLLLFFLKKGLIIRDKKERQIQLYKINVKKIRDYFDEIGITNLFFEYFKYHHTVFW